MKGVLPTNVQYQEGKALSAKLAEKSRAEGREAAAAEQDVCLFLLLDSFAPRFGP